MTVKTLGLSAALAAAVQACGTLISQPHAKYAGSTPETAAELLFTLAFVLAAAAWIALARGAQSRAAAIGSGLVVTGTAGLVTGVIGTVIAGKEVLSGAYVVGFGLLEVGLVVTAAALRSSAVRSWWMLALGVPAVVLSLAFYDTAGLAALALATALLAASPDTAARVKSSRSHVAA
jgi:hypothetical protein